MSQPLLWTISERRTCLLARTQKPAIIRTKQKHASSGLPSSTEAPPLTGRPKMLSHSETGLEQPSVSQRSGSHRPPLTSGLSRMSRRKRKIINATVRQDAMLGGRCIGYIRGLRSEGGGRRTEGRGRRAENGGQRRRLEFSDAPPIGLPSPGCYPVLERNCRWTQLCE